MAILKNRVEKTGPEGIIWTLRGQKSHKGYRGGNENGDKKGNWYTLKTPFLYFTKP